MDLCEEHVLRICYQTQGWEGHFENTFWYNNETPVKKNQVSNIIQVSQYDSDVTWLLSVSFIHVYTWTGEETHISKMTLN